MGFMKPKAPPLPPMPEAPKRSDAEIQAEALAERKRRGAARGRASTILAGDEKVTAGAAKTLLGE